MTVTKTAAQSSNGGTPWVHLSGTILEVLNALSEEMASGGNVVYYSDDGTDAKAVFCRFH